MGHSTACLGVAIGPFNTPPHPAHELWKGGSGSRNKAAGDTAAELDSGEPGVGLRVAGTLARG